MVCVTSGVCRLCWRGGLVGGASDAGCRGGPGHRRLHSFRDDWTSWSLHRDERNLEVNEMIKKELNPQKINEPKTPYLSPIETDDEFDVGELVGQRGGLALWWMPDICGSPERGWTAARDARTTCCGMDWS